MRKFALALVFVLQSSLAWAGCSLGALPFQLQNNTIADATQVMANFNQLVTGAGANCAAAGANNDITSLGALATPLSPSQGGTSVFLGSNSSGTNALTISSTTPQLTNLQTGYRVTFTVGGGTNTGASTVVISGSGAGIKNIFRRTQSGAQQTQGGELIFNQQYDIVYDGVEWVILNDLVYIGEMRDFAGATAPPGWLFADGTNYLQTAFPQLFNIIGQTYGGTAGTFNVPDTRGRVLAGLDNFGSAIGAANRLTNVATGCGSTFTGLGSACANASQSHTLAVAELPAAPPTSGTISGSQTFSNVLTSAGGQNVGSASTPAVNVPGSITVNGSSFTYSGNLGGGSAHPVVNPNLGVLKIIRF